MRSGIVLPILLVVASGCTAMELRRSTVRQVDTLTDVQHQMVLNNLAKFVCNPNTIPSQSNITTGANQVVDSASASSQVLNSAFNSPLLGFGASRGRVDQWSSAPVTDEMTLRLLQIAYRRSLGWKDSVYERDLANRLAHRLKSQISVTGDVGIANAMMLARGPSMPQLLDRAGWNGDDQLGFKATDPAVKLWRKDTEDIISLNSERIIQVGERLEPGTLAIVPAVAYGYGSPPLNQNGPMSQNGEQLPPRVRVATPYAAEVRRQVFALNEYLGEIRGGWLCVGNAKEVPKNVCYVGRCGDCYVWVLPQQRAQFEDLTLRVLRLATMLQQNATPNTGVTFSPIQTR